MHPSKNAKTTDYLKPAFLLRNGFASSRVVRYLPVQSGLIHGGYFVPIVLVFEDEPFIREFVVAELEDEGFTVVRGQERG